MNKIIKIVIILTLCSMCQSVYANAAEMQTTVKVEETTKQQKPVTVKNGFYNENGYKRYYKNNKLQKGFLKIGGKKYYFDKNGNMLTGLRKINKKRYYFNFSGVMQTGTFKVSTIEYKAKSSGVIYSVRNIVKPMSQKPKLTKSSEIAAWDMMANYYGANISQKKAYKIVPKSSNPNKGFIDTKHSKGDHINIVYPNGLKSVTNKYVGDYVNLTKCKTGALKSKLDAKRVVVVWVSGLHKFKSHTILLTGYDTKGFYYNNPWTGKQEKVTYKKFDKMWKKNGKMAMTVGNLNKNLQKDKWYNLDNKIIHAGGGINNVSYTNSKEAITNSLNKNKRIFEIDFMLTSDNVLVARHGWENNKNVRQSLEEFKKTKTAGGFTPMTAEEVIKMLAAKGNTYLVVDTREADVTKAYKAIYDICVKTNNRAFLSRVIPQFYSQDEYWKIKKIYNFTDWIFTLYKLKPKTDAQYKEVAAFCKTNGIDVVTMPKSKVKARRTQILRDSKLLVYTHTVNTQSEFDKMRGLGIHGIYTDFLMN